MTRYFPVNYAYAELMGISHAIDVFLCAAIRYACCWDSRNTIRNAWYKKEGRPGMDTSETKSEVARFRELQALEEEASKRALYATAMVARHDFIIARMERGAERILRLLQEGKQVEAMALMNTRQWGEEEQG